MSYNRIDQVIRRKFSNLPVEAEHPNTGVWVDAVVDSKDSDLYSVIHLNVQEGEYGLGTSRPLRFRLKGSSPVVMGVSDRLITVKNPPNTPPTPVTLTSVTVQGPDSVNEGSSGTYTATGTYSDGSSRTLASGLTWSGNAPNGILTVATNVVQGDGRTTTVSATSGSVTGSKIVTIVDTTVVTNPTFHGVTPSSNPSVAQIKALISESWTRATRTVSYDASQGNGVYLIFAEDFKYGIRTSITDSDGDNITGTFNQSTVSIDGVSYNLYVTQLANYDNPAIIVNFANPG